MVVSNLYIYELLRNGYLRVRVKCTEFRGGIAMYEKILDLEHLKAAFKAVKKNRGSAGIDNITISDYKENLESNLEILQ